MNHENAPASQNKRASALPTAQEKILEAASNLFLEGGIKALSVRAIAARAGVSTIGIYSHFKGKQGILDTLYIEAAEKVAAAMRVDNDALSAEDAIIQCATNYIELSESHEAHYRLFFGESQPDYKPSEEAQAAGKEAFSELMKQSANVLPDGTPPHIVREQALGTWALLHGFFGLKHHASANEMGVKDWKTLMLDTFRRQIPAALSEPEEKAV